MRILVILGHPRRDSFGAALADEYHTGAEAEGAEVRCIAVSELQFDPEVRSADPEHQTLEPDLEAAQSAITWAEHLVFVYPTFWGGLPAKLKGFIDRTFTPGFAFRSFPDAGGRRKLLRGKTAEIITTLDMPPEVYRARYRRPGIEELRRAVLRYCGVQTTRARLIGPIAGSTHEDRAEWLLEQNHAGRRRAHGARSGLQQSARAVASFAVRHRITLYIGAVAILPLLQQLAAAVLLTLSPAASILIGGAAEPGAGAPRTDLLAHLQALPAALLGWAPAMLLAGELLPAELSEAAAQRDPELERRRRITSERRYHAALWISGAALLWVFGLQLFVYGLDRHVWLLLLVLASGKALFNELTVHLRTPETRFEPERVVVLALLFGCACIIPTLLQSGSVG